MYDPKVKFGDDSAVMITLIFGSGNGWRIWDLDYFVGAITLVD
jgi:hypothetical protein